jgi:3-phosphoshikimate 1-carboxyvinyltransferase
MRLNGSFTPPGDKSISHRLVLMALLADGRMEAIGLADGADVRSSLEAARTLGVTAETDGDRVVLTGAGGRLAAEASVDCGNSGTTMRLLMGILAGRPGRFQLFGDRSLTRRPMNRVADPLQAMGANIDATDGRAPVDITGGELRGIHHTQPSASAQVKSALLLAGLQADGVTTVTEPAPSRDHTERLIAAMGGWIESRGRTWTTRRSALTLPPRVHVPGDPSSAAFFLVAAAACPFSRVTARNVSLNPTRTGFLDVLRRMGAEVAVAPDGDRPEPHGSVTVAHRRLDGVEIPADEIPGLVDEIPILSLAAARAEGTTVFRSVAELRVKESDRLAAIADQLGRLGASVDIRGDDLYIFGPAELRAPDRLDASDDHRLAMTLRLAGLAAGGRPEISGETSVAVSYPTFGRDLERLIS